MKRLILTSDDFGMSPIYNEKMLEMIQLRFLSSISVMVERELKGQTDQWASLVKFNNTHNVSLGLHLELEDQNILSDSLRQLNKFQMLLGLKPSYVDVHKIQRVKSNYNEIAQFCIINGLSIRKYNETSIVIKSPVQSFIATNRELPEIIDWIESLKNELIYELIFHIGLFDPNCKSHWNKEREYDIKKLKYVNKLVIKKEIEIVSYKDL